MNQIAHVLLVLLFASSAIAAPTITKDWMTDQGIDEVTGKDSCLTATNVSSGTHRSQLMLSFPKDRLALPQLLLKVWDAPVADSVLKIRISSKVSHPLFVWKSSAQADQPTIYWYAPIGWNDLLEIIVGSNNLGVQGTTLQSQISLRGSSASIDLVKKCLKVSNVLPTDFLKQLNSKATVNEVAYATVADWATALDHTYGIYLQGQAKNQERIELLKPVKKLIEQEAEALKVYNAAQNKWQSVTAELTAKQSTEKGLQNSLAQAKADLATLQLQLALAQDNLKIKKAAYDPVHAQIINLEKVVSVNERALKDNISDSNRLQLRITSLEREIPNLRSERDSLDRQISRLQSEIEPARRAYSDADSKARLYNVDYETRYDLNNDFRYNNAIRYARQARADANQANRDVSIFRSRAQNKSMELRNCRRDPARNCSALAADLNRIQANLSQAQARESNANREAFRFENEAMNIERSIRSNHEREKYRLGLVRDERGRILMDLETQYSRARSRRSAIENELPNLQAELRNAMVNLSALQAQKPRLESDLAVAQGRLDQAKLTLDFTRIEKEYLEAVAQVDNLKNAVATIQKSIVNSEKSLQTITAEIESLKKDLTKRAVVRDQALARLDSIRASLQPIREQEKILNNEIADLLQIFEQGKARHQKTYETSS